MQCSHRRLLAVSRWVAASQCGDWPSSSCALVIQSTRCRSITWWQAFYHCIARPACSASLSRRLSPSSGPHTADARVPAIAHCNFAANYVHRLAPRAQAFKQPHPAAIQQPRHQPTIPLQHRQQARDLLRAGRHLAPRRQFGEKRLALYLSHLSWMPLATCQNEASDPAYIRLLSPQTVMAKPQPTTDLIQQLRSRRRHYACIVTGVRMCLLKRWITQAASTPTPSVAIHKSLLWDRNSPFPDLWP